MVSIKLHVHSVKKLFISVQYPVHNDKKSHKYADKQL